MFQWFNRKKTAINDKVIANADDMLLTAFLNVKSKVDVLDDPIQRAAVAFGVAFAWKAFTAQFRSITDFERQSYQTKNRFVEGLEKMQKELDARGDPEVGVGVYMTAMYISAVMDCSAVVINRLADDLEPYNREGSVLL